MKTIVGCIIICSILLGVWQWFGQNKNTTEPDWIDQLTQEENKIPQEESIMQILPEETAKNTELITIDNNRQSGNNNVQPNPNKSISIPQSIQLNVPFYVQAPDNKWVLPWTETCEEASLVLAAYYIKGLSLNKNLFKQELLSLIEVQKKLFNTYIDTNITQLQELYQSYYNDGTPKIIENPTIEQIKEELAQGNIIVAPFAGRMLQNPHFSGNGPRYHMLVIKGYDEKYFYTNDVGTIHGENFAYPHNIIIDAMHDLIDGDITQGAKRMLVISK